MDNEIEQILNHAKLMENRIDNLNEQNKKIEDEIGKVNTATQLMTEYIEDCFLNKKKLNN